MFQSSRPVKDATATRDAQIPRKYVSILASREGRDRLGAGERAYGLAVSILASREGRDSLLNGAYFARQPRFNPRVPRRTRPLASQLAVEAVNVSILASREGRDFTTDAEFHGMIGFNPRVPRRTRLAL